MKLSTVSILSVLMLSLFATSCSKKIEPIQVQTEDIFHCQDDKDRFVVAQNEGQCLGNKKNKDVIVCQNRNDKLVREEFHQFGGTCKRRSD
jgi:hypothetical protein